MPNDSRFDVPVLSVRDVIDAYKNYDADDSEKEIIISFVSELTGISIDAINWVS